MPAQFLTEAEREHLNRFPEQIAPDDLITYFTLSTTDFRLVEKQYGRRNRLGFALQLGAIRYLGFSPDQLDTAPPEMVGFLAQRLKVSPDALKMYAERAQTRTEHLQKICAYLGFRETTSNDLEVLVNWLLEHALEHDNPVVLFQLAADKLRADRLVRPGVTRLERLVGTVRERT
jgi:TnpA family transposase